MKPKPSSAPSVPLAAKPVSAPPIPTATMGERPTMPPPSDPLASGEDIEELMRMANEEGEIDLNDDVMTALRSNDFTYNPDDDDEDGEGESNIILEKTQKNVAVLPDNLKRHEPSNEKEAIQSRWNFLISSLRPPISTILAHAVVQRFDRTEVSLLLSQAFEGLLSAEHEEYVTQEIRQMFHWSVNFHVSYRDEVDESTSLAAQAARAELERQQKRMAEFERNPLFMAVMQKFQPEPNSVRFSFNSDRKTS